MPKLIPYHLTFSNGLHVGRGVENLAETSVGVPSDTLFAALLDTWHHLGRNVSDLLASETAEPQFRVTSAFPFAGEVRFYPMPVDFAALFSETTLADFDWNKPIKRIRYFSEALLKKALAGEKLDKWLFPKDENAEPTTGVALQGGALWLTKDEVGQLPESIQRKDKLFILRRQLVWKMQTTPRVTLERLSSAPTLFQSERVVFAKDCGLWFGVVGQIGNLSYILPVLGENGLGGERSVGYGGFKSEPQNAIEFATPRPDGFAYLLSRYHPKQDEMAGLQDANAAYTLEAIGGWLRTPTNAAAQRRKRVWMVAEGSRVKGIPLGDAPDVRPEYDAKNGEKITHPVYRPGFALALDWKR
jgi:CRISPR-associated protein Csm4